MKKEIAELSLDKLQVHQEPMLKAYFKLLFLDNLLPPQTQQQELTCQVLRPSHQC